MAAVWVSSEIRLERRKVRYGRPKDQEPSSEGAVTQIRGKL